MGRLHKVRKNLCPTAKVTTEETIKEIEEDPSENYLLPRKMKNREHIVQVTTVKFKDLKEITSGNQTKIC